MKVTLAEPRGFCSGVNRAINILATTVKEKDEPIYAYHEIVHNAWVARDFQRRGVAFVESLDVVPEGAILLFSAHGVSPAIRAQAAARRLRTIDATCPLVHRIHMQIRSFADRGYTIVFIGKRGHDEVVGSLGEAPDATILVSTREEAQALEIEPKRAEKITYMMQTTLSVSEAAAIVEVLRQKFPNIQTPPHDGVCDATQRRQEVVRRLAPEHDLVIVVGSPNSSNSKRLAEVAREVGKPAFLVDRVEDIPWRELTPESKVLLTAGASAPEKVVQTVAQFLRDV
ncbi:MAG: 4-hydroxy-3-methylbut-2-enyl diphosphate reductase [Thermoguttaceae bacterium]|nr:4-hydroxy-3-methylbut-2-enyl diphosphate reductase [Thermoguttaceae bacterium]